MLSGHKYGVGRTCRELYASFPTSVDAVQVAEASGHTAFRYPGGGSEPVAITPMKSGACFRCPGLSNCEIRQAGESTSTPPRVYTHTISSSGMYGPVYGFQNSGGSIETPRTGITPLATALAELNMTVARLTQRMAEEVTVKTKQAEPLKKHRKKNRATVKHAEEALPVQKPEKGYDMDDMSYWTGS